MNLYHFEYWFRHGEFEKDFDHITITAKTEEEARVEVQKIRKWIFSIVLLSTNELKQK